jgi:hypothetical protein
VLLAAIGILFTMGVALGARLQMYIGLDDPLALLRSLAQVGNGIGYFLARWLGFEAGRVTAPTHEYGNTFTEVGGLLNVLLILTPTTSPWGESVIRPPRPLVIFAAGRDGVRDAAADGGNRLRSGRWCSGRSCSR